MSTRGFVGIRKDGKDKGGYNHSNSYYSGLGVEVLNFLKGKSVKELNALFNNIVFVDYEDGDFVDAWDWFKSRLKTRFTNNSEFLKDSLFCEYAYIINLDDRVLEIYRGFNQNPEANGRYASQFLKSEKPAESNNAVLEVDAPDNDYYGVVLVKTIPLRELFAGKWSIKENDLGNGVFEKIKE